MAWSEMSTRDIPDDHFGADVAGRVDGIPSSAIQYPTTASVQKTGNEKSTSTVMIPAPPQSHGPKKKSIKITATKKIKAEQKCERRALRLRNDYPTMKDIPKGVTVAQAKQLTLDHKRNSINVLQPTPSANTAGAKDAYLTKSKSEKVAPPKRITAKEKRRNRAARLKQQYPDMKGIPDKIGKKSMRKLVDQYKAGPTAPAPPVSKPKTSSKKARSGPHSKGLPTRSTGPGATLPTSGMISRHLTVQSYATLMIFRNFPFDVSEANVI